MSYSDADKSLSEVPDELIEVFEDRIRKYASKCDEVNSSKASNSVLQSKPHGQEWREITKGFASQAMGILIRRVLETEDGWYAEKVEDVLSGRSYYIYTRPNKSPDR